MWLSLSFPQEIFEKDRHECWQTGWTHVAVSAPYLLHRHFVLDLVLFSQHSHDGAVFSLSLGVASYTCVGPEGYWDPQGPDVSNCSSPWVNLISQKVPSWHETCTVGPSRACFLHLIRNLLLQWLYGCFCSFVWWLLCFLFPSVLLTVQLMWWMSWRFAFLARAAQRVEWKPIPWHSSLMEC